MWLLGEGFFPKLVHTIFKEFFKDFSVFKFYKSFRLPRFFSPIPARKWETWSFTGCHSFQTRLVGLDRQMIISKSEIWIWPIFLMDLDPDPCMRNWLDPGRIRHGSGSKGFIFNTPFYFFYFDFCSKCCMIYELNVQL